MSSISTNIKKSLLQFVPTSVGTHNVAYCYHSIDTDNWTYTTDPSSFESHILFLLQYKQIVDLPTFLRENRLGKKNLVTITFDDGYEDVYTKALPILQQYGLKATVFITGLQDAAGSTELNSKKKLLSIEQIMELRDKGWTIGYHSWSHPELCNLTSEELDFQITAGKKCLEEILGFPLYYFAYPNGIYNSEIIKTVETAGFHAAFTVNGGNIQPKDNPLLLNRVMIDKTLDQPTEFKSLMNGLGLTVNQSLTKITYNFNGVKRFISLL